MFHLEHPWRVDGQTAPACGLTATRSCERPTTTHDHHRGSGNATKIEHDARPNSRITSHFISRATSYRLLALCFSIARQYRPLSSPASEAGVEAWRICGRENRPLPGKRLGKTFGPTSASSGLRARARTPTRVPHAPPPSRESWRYAHVREFSAAPAFAPP